MQDLITRHIMQDLITRQIMQDNRITSSLQVSSISHKHAFAHAQMPVSFFLVLKMHLCLLETRTIGVSLISHSLNRLCFQDKHLASWARFSLVLFRLGSTISQVRKLPCPNSIPGLLELIRIQFRLA
jgi:hypothetical protein